MKPCLFSQSLSALSLDAAIEAVPLAGFTAVELMCWEPHLDPDTARRRGAEVADAIADNGIAVAALSLSNRLSVPEEAEAQIERARAYMLLAGRFGTNLLKMTPGPPASADSGDEHWSAMETALLRLIPMASDLGLRLAFETHMRQLTDTVAGSLRLLELADSEVVGLTVDFSNLAFAGEDLPAAITAFGDRIFHTHVKNGYVGDDGSWHFLALEKGLTDYAQVLPALKASGYDGYLSVECLGPDAQRMPVETASRDRAILEHYLAAIQGR